MVTLPVWLQLANLRACVSVSYQTYAFMHLLTCDCLRHLLSESPDADRRERVATHGFNRRKRQGSLYENRRISTLLMCYDYPAYSLSTLPLPKSRLFSTI
jgi:hypothetical protein